MKKWIVFMMAFALVLALAACGKKEEAKPANSGATSGKEIKLTATNYQFDQKEIRVKKDEPVTFVLDNKQGVHGMEIKDLKVDLTTSKKSQTVTPNKAGTFDIKCSIPCGDGHATMVAKLIVE